MTNTRLKQPTNDQLHEHMHSFTWGVTNRGMFKANPPLHIVHRVNNDYVTWCGGGGAHANVNNVTRRRCPKCMTLLREDWREYSDEANA